VTRLEAKKVLKKRHLLGVELEDMYFDTSFDSAAGMVVFGYDNMGMVVTNALKHVSKCDFGLQNIKPYVLRAAVVAFQFVFLNSEFSLRSSCDYSKEWQGSRKKILHMQLERMCHV
jgi:hypothetical protein